MTEINVPQKRHVKECDDFDFWIGNFQLDVYFMNLKKKINILF